MDLNATSGPDNPRPSACPPTGTPSTLQVLLGLFIVWQIIYGVVGNLLNVADESRSTLAAPEGEPAHVQKTAEVVEWLAPGWARKEGHVHDAAEVVAGLTRRWGQVTGQVQGWSLFAPSVGRHNTFVAVELRWDDGSPLELLLSDNEPADPNHFFRLGDFRLRKYESHIDVILTLHDDELTEAAAGRWRRLIEDKMDTDAKDMLAYLQWRWRRFQQAHPDRPTPSQVIFYVRRFSIPPPEQVPWRWDTSNYQMFDMQPLARWQPGADRGPDYSPLEMYNHETREFDLRRKR
jgi:hypothetical protein